jgi:hypothetical protein
MWRRLGLLWTDVSEEHIASFFSVKEITCYTVTNRLTTLEGAESTDYNLWGGGVGCGNVNHVEF